MTTSSFVESVHPRTRTGEFTDKRNDAPGGALSDVRDLTVMTPVDVDAELAELYYARADAYARIEVYERETERYRKYIARESHMAGRVADYEKQIAIYEEKITGHRAEVADLRAQMAPLEAEYQRRGRWTRAFLVSGGHLHNTMDCSTCNREGRMTRFAWMTEYSGASEEQIVEAAGDRACTVCHPSAPVAVLSRPSVMFTPDEETAARERAERDAKKSAAAADKAAKAITNPDGSELAEPRKYGQVVRTLVTAERELAGALVDVGIDQHQPMNNREMAAEKRQWRDMLVAAIAHKKGITGEEVLAAAQVKADKKVASILREWGVS